MKHATHPDFSRRANREDPSSWWTILVGAVLSFGITVSVYWVSASYYKAEEEVTEEAVVLEARRELEELKLRQKGSLLRAGERTDDEGTKLRTIPIEHAMEIVVAEERAKRK